MGYTKLFSSILDSTIWQTPIHVKVVWITMLAMVDQDGEVQASVPGLAIRAGVERAQCEQALAILSAPDPDSRTPTAEGRRIEAVAGGWRLINHAVYRHKMSVEERREKEAERKRRYRERVSRDVPSCPAPSRGVASVPDCPSSSLEVPTSEADQKQIQKQTHPQSARDAGVELLPHLDAEWRRVMCNAPGTGSVSTLVKVWRGEPAPTHSVRSHLERVKLVIEAALTETDPKAWLTRTIEGFSRDPYARQRAAGFELYASKPGSYTKAAQVLSSAPSNFDHAPGPDADLPPSLGGPDAR